MSKAGRWYRYPFPEEITQAEILDPEFKQCKIKRPFESREDARVRIERAGRSKSGYLRGTPYKCSYCPSWHITSKRPRPAQSQSTKGESR